VTTRIIDKQKMVSTPPIEVPRLRAPHFHFVRQESRTVADFAPARRAISVTRVTDSSVYDLGSALIGRGVGRMTPRRSMNVDAVQHHPAARE
jgi:hypothetical protein